MRLLTAADIHRLLAEHGVAPRKAAGQNFVVDPNTVRKVVRDAGVGPGDLVCEIGPGLGSLTLALRDAGAFVVAIEIDAGLARALTAVLDGDPAVRIVHADALRADLPRLMDEARAAWGLPAPPAAGEGTGSPGAGGTAGAPAALVANLPYHVATPLVIVALESGAFDSMFVMVQREVGQRWVARPGDEPYSGVSVKIAALADATIAAPVSRRAFHPVPNVDSVTVRLRPRPWTASVPRPALFALVEQGFGQRRKRLRNSLATPVRPPATIEAALAATGRDPGARPEELELDAWAALAAALA